MTPNEHTTDPAELRAAKHWRLYREAQADAARLRRRAEDAEAEALGLHAALGFERGRADAAIHKAEALQAKHDSDRQKR